MRLRSIAVVSISLTVLFAVALGAASSVASAEDTGPNAWCFRPSLVWFPAPGEAYIPDIQCAERELPAGDERWSSTVSAELPVAPDGWELPVRGIRTVRWGWTHEYDPASGQTFVYGEMKRDQGGHSPIGSSAEPDVYLSVICDPSGALHLSIASDVAPLVGRHEIVWWTDRSEYRRVESWNAEELVEGGDYFRAWAPAPRQLWAEIRDSSRLHVIVFGDESWQMAEAYVTRINQLDVVEMLDYCGQDNRVDDQEAE